ncbi:MAG: hypothetical protein AB1432_06280 [Bacteroidota bacterium]
MKKIISIIRNSFILLAISVSVFAQGNKSYRKSVLFDFGPVNSKLAPHSISIDEKLYFNLTDGYGWILPPAHSIERTKMKGTTLRNDLTIDGVAGKEIEFKTKIQPGRWWITFWMEAGYDYTNSAHLKINNMSREINWFRIKAGELGESEYMNLYRVYHSLIEIEGNEFLFNLKGGKDSIRVLALSLIPYEEPVTELHFKIERMVRAAGKYKSKISLNDLNRYLSDQVALYPDDAYLRHAMNCTSLIAEADRLNNMMGWEWASQMTSMGIFDRLHQAICLLDAQLEHDYKQKNPFRERALWMRGKLGYDLNLQRGGKHEKEMAEGDLTELLNLYPEDENLLMLNGHKIDQPDYCDFLPSEPDAPEWSLLQRELICRLSSEIKWWVTERQAPNGELGGKLGDDVELLRWWTPFLLSGNKYAITGWKKLADEVWRSPKVYKGFSKYSIDVEHAAEFISDSTPELLFVDDDSTYYKRLLFTADYFENLWSAKNKFGRRFFKSAWFGSTEVDERPPRNRDVDYNTRALKPLRYIAWYSRDSKSINLLNEWSESWLSVSLNTAKGKPKGVVPPSVRWYDESINGDNHLWYKADMLWDYFDWHHSAGSMILDQMFFTYTLNKNEKLLQPIVLLMEMINQNINQINNNNLQQGSELWAVKMIIGKKNFWEVISKWRLNSKNNAYDSILLKYGNNYTKFRISKNYQFLVDGLIEALEEVRYNNSLRTTLVLHTDRVRTEGADFLKAMITGDGTPEGSSPYYAVTWENTNNNFTVLVTESNNEQLTIETFSFDKEKTDVVARIWQLKNGEYVLSYKNKKGEVLAKEKLNITRVGQRINLSLAPEHVIIIDIRKD